MRQFETYQDFIQELVQDKCRYNVEWMIDNSNPNVIRQYVDNASPNAPGYEYAKNYLSKLDNDLSSITAVSNVETPSIDTKDINPQHHEGFTVSNGITYKGENKIPNVHAQSIDNQDNIQSNIIYDIPKKEPDGSRIVTGVDVVSGTQKQENPIEDPSVRELIYGRPRKPSDIINSSNDDIEKSNLSQSEVVEISEEIPKGENIEITQKQLGPEPGTEEWKAIHGDDRIDEIETNRGYSTSTDQSSNYQSEEQVAKGIEAGRRRVQANSSEDRVNKIQINNVGAAISGGVTGLLGAIKSGFDAKAEVDASLNSILNKIDSEANTRNINENVDGSTSNNSNQAIVFQSNPLDSFKDIQNDSSGYKYNEDDTKKIETNIGIIKDNSMRLRGIVGVILDDIYNTLFEETKKNINFSSIAYEISSYLTSNIISILEDSEQNVSWSRKQIKRTDGGGHASSQGVFSNVNSNPDSSTTTDNEDPTENRNVSDLVDDAGNDAISSETDDLSNITNVDNIDGNNGIDVIEDVSKAVIGMVSFLEIVPLFEQLGDTTTIESSVDSSYKLIGIEKYNGNYYYKIEDSDNNKSYYVKINDKVKLESDTNEIVEVKETTLKLDTPDLNGDNNYAEVLNPEEVFIMTGKEKSSSDENIEMAKIFDFNSGKEGYIQISDKIEIKSIDSLISDNNE